VTIGNGVTSIVDYAFSGCTGLTSVTIGNSVASIGDCVFEVCSSLTSVTIPDSVTSIGDAAFYGCTSLSDVYYGGSEAEWNAVGIDDYNECLTSATIHFNDGTTSGGSTGDSGSTSETLSGICGDSLTWTLEDGVLTISGSGYMYDYEEVGTPWLSLTDSITAVVIEDGVLGISTYAFYGCVNLTSITWPDNLLYIGKCAFDECNSLEDITLPSGLTTLGTSFYGSVYYNDETNWTDNALYIDGWLAAVSDCSEESFVVETGTVGIAMGVLASYDLQSVHIPDSVKYICDYAFAYCEALTDVYYSGSEEDWNAIEIGTENDCLLNATIAYDSGSEGSTTPGDLNGDGEVNASDLTILARHVGKVETMQDETYLATADVTGDGNVDASDLTKLAQYVGKIISSLD
ncbi:MAG: leucine-rich repeat protein, partial [Oscillospiraceae bacterium]|nr:leucine-rich repeat protein [Oscillospiraceae bacterium]